MPPCVWCSRSVAHEALTHVGSLTLGRIDAAWSRVQENWQLYRESLTSSVRPTPALSRWLALAALTALSALLPLPHAALTLSPHRACQTIPQGDGSGLLPPYRRVRVDRKDVKKIQLSNKGGGGDDNAPSNSSRRTEALGVAERRFEAMRAIDEGGASGRVRMDDEPTRKHEEAFDAGMRMNAMCVRGTR
jgi:hypothetical protein